MKEVQVAAGQVGQPPAGKGQDLALVVNALGRLADVKQFEDLTLKTTTEGRTIRLRDVARIEVAAGHTHGPARLNGKPAVVLAISSTPQARPREVGAALQEKLAQLRARLPEGIAVDLAFDFTPNLEAPDGPTTPEYLLLDLDLPPGASAERTLAALKHGEALLRDAKEIQDFLALSEHPFDRSRDRPCILLRLLPAARRQTSREQLMRTLRSRLEQVPGAVLRLRDVSAPGRFPWWGYPIDFAVHGPDAGRVRELAQKLAERLQKDKKLTDVWLDPASTPQSQLYLVTANPASGVSLTEARRLCESLAEEVRKELQLSAEYRLTWLQEPLAPK